MGNCVRHSGNVTVLSATRRLSRNSGGPGGTSYRSYDDLSPVAKCESFHLEIEETTTVSETSNNSKSSKIFSRARKLKIRGLLKANKGVSNLHADTAEVPEILVTNPDGVCRKAMSVEVSDENQNLSHFVSYTQIDIPEVSLGSFLLRQFDLNGDQVAVIDPQNDESYRYRDMAERTRRVASALWKRGFRQGDALCVVVPRNSIEVAPVMCATWCSGGICSLIDPESSIEVLSRRIREIQPMVLVTDASLADRLLQATSMAGILTEIYTIGLVVGFHPLTELYDDNGSGFPSRIKLQPRKTCALILYSDKTNPRAVKLSHYNVLSNVLQVQTTLSVKRGSTLACFLPLTDHFGLIASLLCGFASGAKVILVRKPTMEHCVTAIIKYKPRRIHISSEMAKTMFLNEMMTLCDLSPLESVLCGTAPLSAEDQHIITSKIGEAKVYQALGSTETLITHCGCPLITTPSGSCGNLLPNTTCKILDRSTSTPLYTDVTGEIWVNGPQCMMGYLTDQTAGGRPSQEWIFTENIGHVDTAGNLFVDGESKPP